LILKYSCYICIVLYITKLMGKIISFANQKGGVGKTSLCAIFANHLTAKGQKVSVKDMDIQMSLSGHREDDLKVDPEAKPSWNVEFVNPMDSKEVAAKLQAWKADDSITLIDAPGSLAFPGLVPILKNADIIVIPMTYDHDVLRSTLGFLKVVLGTLQVKAKLVFLPNRINVSEGTQEELTQQRHNADILKKYGILAPRIKQSVKVKRYSTIYENDTYLEKAVAYAFEPIVELIKK